MPFKKGNKGRPEGSVGKLTKSFKDLVQSTFEQLEEKGEGMLTWAQANKTDFYKIASKLIPQEMGIKAEIITQVHTIKLPDGTQIEI